MMTRREFLAASVKAGTAAFLLGGMRNIDRLFAQTLQGSAAPKPPDIVAVKGGSQAARLDRALKELGGIGAFVHKGQTVVIKPNIGWSASRARRQFVLLSGYRHSGRGHSQKDESP